MTDIEIEIKFNQARKEWVAADVAVEYTEDIGEQD